MTLHSIEAIQKQNELSKVGRKILEFNMSIFDRIVVYLFMDKFYIYQVSMNEFGESTYELRDIDDTAIMPLLTEMRTVLCNPVTFNF